MISPWFRKWFHAVMAPSDYCGHQNSRLTRSMTQDCILTVSLPRRDQVCLAAFGQKSSLFFCFGALVLLNILNRARGSMLLGQRCVYQLANTHPVCRTVQFWQNVSGKRKHMKLAGWVFFPHPHSPLRAAAPLAFTHLHVPGVPCHVLLINFITSHSFMSFLWQLLW